jgi:hypothetical protein
MKSKITIALVGGMWHVLLNGVAAVRCESKAEALARRTALRKLEVR